ncbi:hypothetical protein IE4803_PC00340 (plasmid) [Rhizobium etli bv. phaseoli str. IE4803]|nr:hypothetical protein IE4803_PC00340 [Rhizobium etli bv. phaseoli str. IE4803]
MKRSERHVFLHRQTMMTLFARPDLMTSPDGCKVARLARLIWFDGFSISRGYAEKLALSAGDC